MRIGQRCRGREQAGLLRLLSACRQSTKFILRDGRRGKNPAKLSRAIYGRGSCTRIDLNSF